MNVKLDNPQVLRYMSENLSQLTGIADAFIRNFRHLDWHKSKI